MKTINRPTYLIIHATYNDVVFGLARAGQLFASENHVERRLSQSLILLLEAFLDKHKVPLSELSFIAVTAGPGMFSSLRSVLATVNGIAHASGLLMVSCDGILLESDLLAQNFAPSAGSVINVALLNAYNSELYYRIERQERDGSRYLIAGPAYAPVAEVATLVTELSVGRAVRMAGNGCALLADQGLNGGVQEYSAAQVAQALAVQSWRAWEAGEAVDELMPLYLKETTFKKQAPLFS